MLNRKQAYYFTDSQGYGRYTPVEDDHKPFLKESMQIKLLVESIIS